jgi:hypothetical protein
MANPTPIIRGALTKAKEVLIPVKEALIASTKKQKNLTQAQEAQNIDNYHYDNMEKYLASKYPSLSEAKLQDILAGVAPEKVIKIQGAPYTKDALFQDAHNATYNISRRGASWSEPTSATPGLSLEGSKLQAQNMRDWLAHHFNDSLGKAQIQAIVKGTTPDAPIVSPYAEALAKENNFKTHADVIKEAQRMTATPTTQGEQWYKWRENNTQEY